MHAHGAKNKEKGLQVVMACSAYSAVRTLQIWDVEGLMAIDRKRSHVHGLLRVGPHRAPHGDHQCPRGQVIIARLVEAADPVHIIARDD